MIDHIACDYTGELVEVPVLRPLNGFGHSGPGQGAERALVFFVDGVPTYARSRDVVMRALRGNPELLGPHPENEPAPVRDLDLATATIPDEPPAQDDVDFAAFERSLDLQLVETDKSPEQAADEALERAGYGMVAGVGVGDDDEEPS